MNIIKEIENEELTIEELTDILMENMNIEDEIVFELEDKLKFDHDEMKNIDFRNFCKDKEIDIRELEDYINKLKVINELGYCIHCGASISEFDSECPECGEVNEI